MPRTPDNEDPTTGTPPVHGDRFSDSLERIGPYWFKRKIGAGGMGVVYEAIHERLGRSVALKLIDQAWSSTEMQRRFGEERDILSVLNHRAIPHIYDAGEFERDGEMLPYIVMEYIVGARPVTTYCHESTMGVEGVLEMFEELFDALDLVHRKGIVHRDIKPGNILVDSEGRARIIDFGLSLATGGRAAMDSLHAERGVPAGTPAYMSPEQRTGDPQALNERTDVYSMALVLYEALAGERPSIGPGGLTKLHQAAPGLPRELGTTLAAALRENPTERTISAGAVRDSLKQIREKMLVGETVHARVEPERVRERLAVSVLMLLAAAIGAFGLFPLCVGVLPFCSMYANWASSALSVGDEGYRFVRVVSVTAETFAADSVAGEGNPPVSVYDARAKHGELMDQLVDGAASAIAWDLYFKSPTDHDESIALGIRRAATRHVPVVLMTTEWAEDEPVSRVTPLLESTPATPAVVPGVFTGDSPWRVDLAIRKGDGFVEPGFALAAVSLMGHPGAQIDVEMRESENELWVRLWEPDQVQGRRPVGTMRSYKVSGVRPVDEQAARIGLSPGDVTAQLMISIPPDDVLDQATVRYEDVLTMDKNELTSMFNRQIVVIGRTDEAARDVKSHPGGRRVPGCYAHAGAIEALMRARQISVPEDMVMGAMSAIGGALGVLCLFRGGRSAIVGGILLGVFILLAILGCLVSLSADRIVYPSPLVLSIGLGGVIGAFGWRLMEPVRRAAGG